MSLCKNIKDDLERKHSWARCLGGEQSFSERFHRDTAHSFGFITLKMLTHIWNQSSHRDKIKVLSRKICRSEHPLVIWAAFTTSVSIVLTELESQRKCNRNLAVDMTSWDYKEKYSFKILLHNGSIYLFNGKNMLGHSKFLEIMSPVFWKDEKSLLHAVCMWRLFSVSPKLKHISRNFIEINSK